MGNQPVLPGMTRADEKNMKERGRRELDAALDRVRDNAGPGWFDRAIQIVRDVALNHETFTTDHIRAWAKRSNLPEAREPRAWGSVMSRAIKSGMIVKTGEYVPTLRPEAHRRPIPVYRKTKSY